MKPRAIFSPFIFSLVLPVAFGLGSSSCKLEPKSDYCAVERPPPGADYNPFAANMNPGGRAVGEPCAHDNQCATNRCSSDPIAGTCGECVTIRPLGQTCTGPHEGCSISAICQDGICKSLRKVEGEGCALGPKGGDQGECDVELFCARTRGYDGPGTCTRYTPVGDCCGEGLSLCGPGTVCNRQTLLCEVRPEGYCTLGYYCSGETVCGDDGRCHPGTLPAGAECGILNGEFIDNACSPGFKCGNRDYPNGGTNETTCVPLPVQGETCQNGSCADGLFCWRSPETDVITECQLPRNEGEACNVFNYYQTPCAADLECRGNICSRPCQ